MLNPVENKVRKLIGETTDRSGKPEMEDTLQDLGYDSSQVDVLVIYLEEEFSISIPDDSILPSTKVRMVCRKMEELVPC